MTARKVAFRARLLYSLPMPFDYTAPATTGAEKAFETYRFYLVCVQRILTAEHKHWETFGEECFHRTKTLQGMKTVDQTWVGRWLKIAWNTEHLLTVALE